MTTALAETRADSRPVMRFDPDKIELIKRTIAPDHTDDELKLFLYQCERTGLDPFTRQIYSTKRRQQRRGQWVEVATTQVAIDGFRVVANRTGEYDGHEVEWCGPDGVWRDVWLEQAPPAAARVVVHRRNCLHAFPAVVRWDEYCQRSTDGAPVAMWRKMPANQLAKCGEALALRKAFPNELSGLYTTDEMAQAATDEAPPQAPPVTQPLAPVPADGQLRLARVKPYNVGKTQHAEITLSNGLILIARGPQLVALCEQLVQDADVVEVSTKQTKARDGTTVEQLLAVHRAVNAPLPHDPGAPAPRAPAPDEPSADDIPF